MVRGAVREVRRDEVGSLGGTACFCYVYDRL